MNCRVHPTQIKQNCNAGWWRLYKMERERSREKHVTTNKIHSLLLISSQTATSFPLQYFSMIYQAMNQVAGIPDSLLTSQKENIHVRNIKPQWAITHLSRGREHPASLCNEDGSHCTSASSGTKCRIFLKSSSSAGLAQRGSSLCICTYIQMQMTLKWWGGHTKAALEAAQQQPAPHGPHCPSHLSRSHRWRDGASFLYHAGKEKGGDISGEVPVQSCAVSGEVSGCLGRITKSELGHNVQ